MVLMATKSVNKPPVGEPELAADDDSQVTKEILVIAQEVKIVQALACNDVNKRNRQIRKLRKWLQLRSQSSFKFIEEDFVRIWKGLYYNMWMSDKPLVQEELAEQLGKLLQCFNGDMEASVNFFGAFIRTMCQEWFGIDQWRIDKFLMLARRMLRYMFAALKDAGWKKASVQRFNEHMLLTVLADNCSARGLTMHYLDIFFEELAKVADGKISAQQVGDFARPFVHFLCNQKDSKLIFHCRTRVFYHLLYQSAIGREYIEKYTAWRQMGFPTASINDLEKDDKAEEEINEDEVADEERQNKQTHFDPRAGNVDVFMPELPLDATYIIDELEQFLYKHESNTKSRKMVKKLLDIFKTYQSGTFPLGVKTMPRFEVKSEKPLLKEKIDQLNDMENEMFGTGRKLKQLNKRKRRKLLNSLNFENVDENNMDAVIEKALPKQYLKERRKRAMMSGWLEEEISNEATAPKKKKKAKQDTKNQKPVASQDADAPPKKMKKLANDENVEKQPKCEAKSLASAIEAPNTDNSSSKSAKTSEWDEPLAEGEIEYFLQSRKLQMKKANANLVPNPLAKKAANAALTTPKHSKKVNSNGATTANNTPQTPGSVKRVKIALKHNTIQKPSEYMKQIMSSPDVPYDASRKPGKGLLKPNSMPSPINPFYKKKIGLRLSNDTI